MSTEKVDRDSEQVAEVLVRLTPELNKRDPRFNPEALQFLIAACEAGQIKWSEVVDLLGAALRVSFAMDEAMQERSDNGREPVIDPNAYGLTI